MQMKSWRFLNLFVTLLLVVATLSIPVIAETLNEPATAPYTDRVASNGGQDKIERRG
jgi:hypothetical protein